jgi:hypothetical protein
LLGLRLRLGRARQRYSKDNTAPAADVSHVKYPPGAQRSVE